jgi:hypothetical protein
MEKEINNRKVPGSILSTFLFFFFYLIIRTLFKDVPLMYNNMMDAAIAEDESVVISLCLAFLDIIMLCLSFWSIIRLLKGKPDCITCIRWALCINFFVLLYEFFVKSLGRAIVYHWTYAILPIVPLLFTIIFFIYLAKSHSIKQLYPTFERKYSPGGWVWLSFFIICLFCFAFFFYTYYNEEKRSKTVDDESLSLPLGYFSDGRIVFTSNSNWSRSEKEIMDIDDISQKATMWESREDSISKHIISGVTPKRRHSDFMTILLQHLPDEQRFFIREVSACDTVINEEQYYVDQYLYERDSISYLWTFSVRFDSHSHKFCAYSMYGINLKEKKEMNDVLSFLNSVIFDLKPYVKEQ